MKLEDFKKIIDEMCYHTNQVALGGRGDPNHHENFREIVEYCRSKNVVPNYTTSGIDLTDEQIEISKQCGAVAVSDYEQPHTYEALRKLIEAGIKTNIHQIFSYITSEKCCNIVMGKVPDFWNFDYTKLNAVIFLLFKPHGAGIKLPQYIPIEEQIKEFSEIIFNPHCVFKVGMDSCLVNYVSNWGNPTPIQKASIDTCEAARMSAYITPDMKFMPCSFADENKWAIPICNNLHEIWREGKSFKKFRKVLKKQSDVCPLGL
jgi:MoaA/NifB/PqqE/SkfB family radical SAM enzyme